MTSTNRFGHEFWIKLLITILSAIGASVGASAMGLPEVASAGTGFIVGGLASLK